MGVTIWEAGRAWASTVRTVSTSRDISAIDSGSGCELSPNPCIIVLKSGSNCFLRGLGGIVEKVFRGDAQNEDHGTEKRSLLRCDTIGYDPPRCLLCQC